MPWSPTTKIFLTSFVNTFASFAESIFLLQKISILSTLSHKNPKLPPKIDDIPNDQS